jgi:hypothetical protein
MIEAEEGAPSPSCSSARASPGSGGAKSELLARALAPGARDRVRRRHRARSARRELLRSRCRVVWLDVSPARPRAAWARAHPAGRCSRAPLPRRLAALLQTRAPLYPRSRRARRHRRPERRAGRGARARIRRPRAGVAGVVRSGSAARAAAALLLSAAFVSCAPHVVAPPRLEPASIAGRYRLAATRARRSQRWSTPKPARGSAGDSLGDCRASTRGSRWALRMRSACASSRCSALPSTSQRGAIARVLPAATPRGRQVRRGHRHGRRARAGPARRAGAGRHLAAAGGGVGARALRRLDPGRALGENGDSLALGVGSDGLPDCLAARPARGCRGRALHSMAGARAHRRGRRTWSSRIVPRG